MWARLGAATVLVGIASLAGYAHSADRTVPFTIGSKSLTIAIPDGFCVPTNSLKTMAEQAASANPTGLTPVTLVACNRNPNVAPWDNYVLVQVPLQFVDRELAKAPALDRLDAEMRSPNAPKVDEKMTQTIADGYEKAVGTRVEVRGTVGYAGRDSDCVYFGGPAQVQVQEATEWGQFVTCITGAHGRLFSINVYEFPAVKSIDALKAQARSIAITTYR